MSGSAALQTAPTPVRVAMARPSAGTSAAETRADDRDRPIAIAAGGTGGHFFPAEALAATLMARGWRVVLLTDARSGGLNSPVFANAETHVLPGAGIAGRGVLRAIAAVLAMLVGTLQARALLVRLNASAVVGFGGYPCVPPVLATRLLRRRPAVVLQEQNAVLGRANRFLARFADRLALGFAATRRVPAGTQTAITGNPVRPAIAALFDAAYAAPIPDDAGPDYASPGDAIRLTVLGGSLGARVFSDVVPAALVALPAALRDRLRVTQQCRQEDLERVRAVYAQAGIEATLAPFFTDVADRLRTAHLVVARAGASTVAELAVAGRPAILVPLPGAIDDHQTGNARALTQAGGAWTMPQSTFTPASLTEKLTALFNDPKALTAASAAARTQARPDAAAGLADLVEALIQQEARA